MFVLENMVAANTLMIIKLKLHMTMMECHSKLIQALIGYGGHSYDRAKFAGNEAIQLDSEGVDLDGDNIVDGFIDYWDISKPKNTNGTFEFTATSINNAAVSKSTSIYIK